MKVLDAWDAIQMAWEHYKKDSITVLELHEWCDMYEEEHPKSLPYICRDDIHHEHDCVRIWWEIVDQGADIIHKQESLICPCCDKRSYKFPHTDRFEKIVEMVGVMKILRENK